MIEFTHNPNKKRWSICDAQIEQINSHACSWGPGARFCVCGVTLGAQRGHRLTEAGHDALNSGDWRHQTLGTGITGFQTNWVTRRQKCAEERQGDSDQAQVGDRGKYFKWSEWPLEDISSSSSSLLKNYSVVWYSWSHRTFRKSVFPTRVCKVKGRDWGNGAIT